MIFDPGMIPGDIDSFEKLGFWCSTCLNYSGFGLQYNERPPQPGDQGIQNVFERTGPFKSFDADTRVVYREAYKLAPDYGSTAYTMDYQAVLSLISASPNVAFLNPNYTAA